MKTRTEQSGGNADVEPHAIASFVWKDRESSDELLVEVRGSETFLEQLEIMGFERLGGGGGTATSRGMAGVVRVNATADEAERGSKAKS